MNFERRIFMITNMGEVLLTDLKNLHLPAKSSHKGENGKLLIIGGSHLFHSASLWALKVASRIVDLVHYSSIAENNQIVQKLKEEFRAGIVIPRAEIEGYVKEDDCILIGPGMVRAENFQPETGRSKTLNLKEIIDLTEEGEQTYYLTKYLLNKYPQKKWVIDAGALQMLEPSWIPPQAILTPHHGEFERLKNKMSQGNTAMSQLSLKEQVKFLAKQYNCVVLLKGETDIIASSDKIKLVKGGNAGMTKGGTGDVLAGLVAAFYCQNEAWTAVEAAAFINKKAGSDLFSKMGYWFNASDLADQIPQTMKRLILTK